MKTTSEDGGYHLAEKELLRKIDVCISNISESARDIASTDIMEDALTDVRLLRHYEETRKELSEQLGALYRAYDLYKLK